MQKSHHALLSLFLLPLTVASATGSEGSEQSPAEFEHPAEVALQKLGEGEFRYVHAGTSMRLYVYDKDSPGKSNCTGGCASARPPLRAGENAEQPIGDWTLVERQDGSKQWAYKGRPVYFLFHDSASDPQGHKPSQGWHFLEP